VQGSVLAGVPSASTSRLGLRQIENASFLLMQSAWSDF